MNCRYLKLVLIILDEFGISIVQDECEIHEESSNSMTNFLLTQKIFFLTCFLNQKMLIQFDFN